MPDGKIAGRIQVVPSEFDVNAYLYNGVVTNDYGSSPNPGDDAFRFECEASHLVCDDPTRPIK